MTTTAIEKKTDTPTTAEQYPIVRPVVNIYENSDEFLLLAEMAGVKKGDINIDLENNVLSLSAVRHLAPRGEGARFEEFGSVEYRNSFSIPETIEKTEVSAKFEDGILHLTLPKQEAVKPRLIAVQ